MWFFNVGLRLSDKTKLKLRWMTKIIAIINELLKKQISVIDVIFNKENHYIPRLYTFYGL